MNEQTEKPPEPQETWAIVELMGHVRLAGRLTEEERFGGKLGRLDIPDGEGFVSQFFGAASVYRITIVTEAVARQVSKQTTPAPISPWDFPKQLPNMAYEGRGSSDTGRLNDDDEDEDAGLAMNERDGQW